MGDFFNGRSVALRMSGLVRAMIGMAGSVALLVAVSGSLSLSVTPAFAFDLDLCDTVGGSAGIDKQANDSDVISIGPGVVHIGDAYDVIFDITTSDGSLQEVDVTPPLDGLHFRNNVTAGFNNDYVATQDGSGNLQLKVTDDSPFVTSFHISCLRHRHTTLALTSSSNPAAPGSSVTFVATLADASSPTGTITITDNGTPIGGPLDAATSPVEVTTGPLAEGAHTIVASYNGDASNVASSATLIQVVGVATTSQIDRFFKDRAGIILGNEGDIGDHIDKLNNTSGGDGDPNQVSALMGLMPIANGDGGTVDVSLGAIQKATGQRKPGPLDIWLKGTYGVLADEGASGRFGLGSAGVDYTVNRDLLVGGFAELDSVSQVDGVASISGLGWLAGPYATARLGENVFLDVKAGAGTSANRISPLGTYTDSFDAVRWLVSATLQGSWTSGAWTFEPVARASYFQESSDAYTDGLGIYVPSVTTGLGQFALGPKVSYRFVTDGEVAIDTGLKTEAVLDIDRSMGAFALGDVHGRVEGSIGVAIPTGARLGLTVAYDGIGGGTARTLSGKVSLSANLD
ncbi:MAG TPA: Ig-like domain repeat protein [Reyranella sp.]